MSKVQQSQQAHAQPATKNHKTDHAKISRVDTAQLLEAPETMRSEDVLSAQQQVGNQVVQRALDKDARRKALTDEQGNLAPEITSQIQQKRGGGSPLPENIQKEAAKKLGRSFKDVRIHTDESADTLSRTINARAFTIGKDIFFKNGVFSPGSGAGRETIIHELTHVVQQGGGKSGASGALKLGGRDTAQEKEADRIGKKHAASIGAAPVGAVQREAEEEELQMQPAEEEELQMQAAEEDELQMQPAEEEELQMQGEEEELQMQPDAGGVIQRGIDLEELKAKSTEMQQKVSKKRMLPGVEGKAKSMGLGSDTHVKKLNKLGSNPDIAREKLHSELKKKAPGMGLGSEQHKTKLMDIDKKRDKKLKSFYLDEQKAGTSGNLNASIEKKKTDEAQVEKTKKQSGAKEKWMATLKDPKASKEDIAKAKERLGAFHKDVGKKDFKAAKAERRTSLEEAAKSGDDDAYEKWQSERKKTKGEKAKSFFKSAGKKMGSGLLSAGKWAGGKALGFAKKQINSGVDHFLGTKSDDKDDDKPSVNIVNNIGGAGGSSGGGGVGAVMEKYSEVLQENKKLKEELAGLKKTV
ncbi:MAG: hypothetical protein CVU44_08215 [Chloroflexi bacterium HGW-Chloroflexi-6]|nr:MAG: hypothetical protein CVU44_08215 [Chloroflexi bacterium HGW-Chloroflexi-6]